MWFKLSVVWWTDLETKAPNPEWKEYHEWTDPLENINGDFVDRDFNIRIHQILETVESLELSTDWRKSRQETWIKWRVEHGIKDMSDKQLRDIVMATELSIINTKPSYFTALCGEIIERVVGTVARVI